MKILIAGATGMVGRALVKDLKSTHEICVLGRSKTKMDKIFPSLLALTWDELSKEHIEKFDIVINLSGANIGEGRWTQKRKTEILQSRVSATQKLADLCAQAKSKKIRLLNASAIGVYGSVKNPQNPLTEVFNEKSKIPKSSSDFLCEVGVAWENATAAMQKANKKVTLMRFAVVLDPSGGALAKMLPAFKWGLGGTIGSGKQPFSWVSLDDLVSAIHFLIDHPSITGPVNIVAPDVIPQKEFAQTLASSLNRPAIFKLPSAFIKLQFGQMGEECLLNGVSVKGVVLDKAKFVFKYPTLSQYCKSLGEKH